MTRGGILIALAMCMPVVPARAGDLEEALRSAGAAFEGVSFSKARSLALPGADIVAKDGSHRGGDHRGGGRDHGRDHYRDRDPYRDYYRDRYRDRYTPPPTYEPPSSGGGCFIAGSMVMTPSGQKPIESLRPGDAVYSYDEKAGKVVESKVTAVHAHARQPYGTLTLGDGTRIGVTPNHRFHSGGSWEAIGKLKPGSPLTGMDSSSSVQGYEGPKEGSVADVYNLTVEGLHNYFVNGVLVHNVNIAF